ncbi:MAG: hypothetical protein AUH09_01145 [Candidatus Rokubacteria bacterium 13_2_20CM_70_12]|nr:MAG: hypothetical protein AUH09_01145 [Candidatus Rokubacteria bacterium 13_2_20CM_70_12]
MTTSPGSSARVSAESTTRRPSGSNRTSTPPGTSSRPSGEPDGPTSSARPATGVSTRVSTSPNFPVLLRSA